MSIETTITALMKKSFNEMIKGVRTSIVGHVLAFDNDTQLAQIQIGVKRVDLNCKTYTPSPLIEVPVTFVGGDYIVETQIDVGTEGLIIICDRCIAEWIDHGGVADNPIPRFHDVNDAVFIPFLRSQPNSIKSFSNNGVKLRNKDNTNYMWLKNDGTQELSNGGGKITLLADGTVNINGVTIDPQGNITATTVTGGGISLSTHTHTGVTSGKDNTGLPQ